STMQLRRWPAAGLTAIALALSASPTFGADVSPSPAPTQDPAAGSTARHASAPIGGAELGGSGLLVHALPGAPAIPAIVNSPAWIVADLDTGKVLAARDPHGRFRPASTLKELTALTLIPKIDASSTITFTSEEFDRATYGTHGVSSLAGLMPGH